jgi:hypothetical protein
MIYVPNAVFAGLVVVAVAFLLAGAIDEQGVVRHRHDHRLWFDYQSVDELKAALLLAGVAASRARQPLDVGVGSRSAGRASAPRRAWSSISSTCMLRGRSPGPGERRRQTPSESSSQEL